MGSVHRLLSTSHNFRVLVILPRVFHPSPISMAGPIAWSCWTRHISPHTTAAGWTVLHFWSHEPPLEVANRICEAMEKRERPASGSAR